MAITAIVLPSCNVSRKGSTRGGTVEADSLSQEEEAARRAALWEEFGEEDYQPLPTGWDEPYKRRYRREQARLEKQLAREREQQGIEADSTISWEAPLEIIPQDSTATDSPAPPVVSPETGEERPSGADDGESPAPEGEAGEDETPSTATGEGDKPAMKKVDYRGDVIRPIQITEDSTAINILGNVVFYHNGAVITCDSAVRYSERRMEFYKRVVINNGTTYVYGDRAEYNGEQNLARVYSPIVKVVDEDAVLYTYNFTYNTLTEVGRYWGGGTLTHNDNQMESQRGFYNTERREFTGAGDVELTNPDYKMISDSVRYNLDTEVAEFFVPTQIWNANGEILLADRGTYRSATDDYDFTKNSYILTETQEMWADSMRHFAETDHTIFRRNIQIIDEDNDSMAFGDYGEYWGETEQGFLTLDPSLVSYDTEEADTVYMRADSILFYTYPYDHIFEGLDTSDEGGVNDFEELLERPVLPGTDGLDNEGEEGSEAGEDEEPVQNGAAPSEGAGDDETGTASEEEGPPDEAPQLTKKELRQAKKAAKKNGTATADTEEDTTEEPGESAENIDATEIDSDAEAEAVSAGEENEDSGEDTAIEDFEEDEDLPEPEPEIYVSPYGDLMERLHTLVAADSVQQAMPAEQFWLSVRDEIREDSTKMDYYFFAVEDALASGDLDGENMEIPAGNLETIIETVMSESERVAASIPAVRPGEDAQESDSVQRVVYGYRDVRIFREDFQAVCDSIIGFSRDSTLHMHINPVMWSDQNQVVSDVMIIYTKDEQLYKAEYFGSPFMSSEVDSLANQYNQIKGKFMVAWFRDNDIYRHDVFGNGQTYYYMEDDATGEVQGFMICESADITFFIEEQTIDEIVYRGEPDYIIYPIEMIPPDVEQILPGFTWEAHRRPRSREDVFTRTIRPRERERVLALPQPTFPLTESITERREQLTQQNIWRDRNDTLSPLALDFIRETELRYAEEARQSQ